MDSWALSGAQLRTSECFVVNSLRETRAGRELVWWQRATTLQPCELVDAWEFEKPHLDTTTLWLAEGLVLELSALYTVALRGKWWKVGALESHRKYVLWSQLRQAAHASPSGLM